MRKILYAVAVAAALLLPACSDPEAAVKTAKAHGFRDVQVTGHRWTGCGRDDDTSTGFTAFNQNGDAVSGVVCSNWSPFGKTNTLRIDE